jgi:signal transduction histidine kinase
VKATQKVGYDICNENDFEASFHKIVIVTDGLCGSTGAILGRSLFGLKNLVDRAMAELRSEPITILAGNIDVAQFLTEIEGTASGRANLRDVRIDLHPGKGGVEVYGDRHALASAVLNLLQNAIKFTPTHGSITLTSSATITRVLIEVQDECGGLQPGYEAHLFAGEAPSGTDRTGLGLGLLFSRSAVEELGGILSVRDLPGEGCVFSISLPRVQDVVLERIVSIDAS